MCRQYDREEVDATLAAEGLAQDEPQYDKNDEADEDEAEPSDRQEQEHANDTEDSDAQSHSNMGDDDDDANDLPKPLAFTPFAIWILDKLAKNQLEAILQATWSVEWTESKQNWRDNVSILTALFSDDLWCPFAYYLYFPHTRLNLKSIQRLIKTRRNNADLDWKMLYCEAIRRHRMRLNEKESNRKKKLSSWYNKFAKQDIKTADVEAALAACQRQLLSSQQKEEDRGEVDHGNEEDDQMESSNEKDKGGSITHRRRGKKGKGKALEKRKRHRSPSTASDPGLASQHVAKSRKTTPPLCSASDGELPSAEPGSASLKKQQTPRLAQPAQFQRETTESLYGVSPLGSPAAEAGRASSPQQKTSVHESSILAQLPDSPVLGADAGNTTPRAPGDNKSVSPSNDEWYESAEESMMPFPGSKARQHSNVSRPADPVAVTMQIHAGVEQLEQSVSTSAGGESNGSGDSSVDTSTRIATDDGRPLSNFDKALERLQTNQECWLDDDTVNLFVHMAASFSPLFLSAPSGYLDPRSPSADEAVLISIKARFDAETRPLAVTHVLFPWCSQGHWFLGLASFSESKIAVLDSQNLHLNTNIKECLQSFVQKYLPPAPSDVHPVGASLVGSWRVDKGSCPMQKNNFDCGVHVIANAIHLVANDTEYRLGTVPGRLWRLIIVSILKNEPLLSTLQAVSMPSTYMPWLLVCIINVLTICHATRNTSTDLTARTLKC